VILISDRDLSLGHFWRAEVGQFWRAARQLADPERLRRELTAAGLRNVKVDVMTETTEFETG
jgi:hypothetical protein